jgi:pyridinium-3,5-biscarboxylic acid mononucleotide sulfurtransferase
MLGSWESCLVAYSGGVDSAFLAMAAKQALGDRALAVIADSPSLPRRELAGATALASRFQIPLRVINTAEFTNPDYTSNPVNRCYFCKHELFTVLEQIAAREGFQVLAYGENASDIGDFRPGAQAAKEFQVRAPLKELGFTKSEIRELSAQLPCLSSRVPHGETVTLEKLRMIEAAENVLRDLDFRDVRVRHHEPGSLKSEGGGQEAKVGAALVSSFRPPASSPLARVEVGAGELSRLMAVAGRVDAALREIGYGEVVIDPEGYRRGSLNATTA